MPHIIIEYSANVEPDIDMAEFCERLRLVATGIEAFPLPGIRVRAFRADHCAIADGNPAHGFIDISIRLRAGRTARVKAEAVQTLFDAARQYLSPAMQDRSLALSMEMRDIDPELSPKTGTIRDYL